jgi:hypothetical protein
MKVTINVTQEDIDKGEKLNCSACPIGLALARAGFPVTSVMWFTVGDKTSILDYVSTLERHPINQFMADFDGGCEVKPFSFVLDLSEEEQKMDKAYLGDSVYVEPDSDSPDYQLKLTTNNGLGDTNEIYLDHSVCDLLIEYIREWKKND